MNLYTLFITFNLLLIDQAVWKEVDKAEKIYTGYTISPFMMQVGGSYVRNKTTAPTKLIINEDGHFELSHPDLSIRPNKTQPFFCKGKWVKKGDTLILNSNYQFPDFITVYENKKYFCDYDILGIEVKYHESEYNPTYYIDGLPYKSSNKRDTSVQTFNDISIKLVDAEYDNDDNYYAVSDSKPSFFRNTKPKLIQLSRFHRSIRTWKHIVKDSTANYFTCILRPDIDNQSLVVENEKFLVVDSLLVHLHKSFLDIDTFKLTE